MEHIIDNRSKHHIEICYACIRLLSLLTFKKVPVIERKMNSLKNTINKQLDHINQKDPYKL
ncbi:hypothetical protein CON65_00085 [Bacillus pseudomycoides]|uniref:Uncharacterized protein n=1 Tax=Bacillus pseudomycoides TaxID=64104 RepID=A0AA91VGA0_9BACI|nr:hypothetical protein COO03_21350 [Bacillus sp. AFS098217]PED84660.1 hypothetical protein CON65_00085 [Bacillus pseudomycoides]PEU07045.1 hypothetical protein CN524_21585 [Bacillus sp. AFS019443]PEU18355.1 hypothetical protein CN525_11980 [Bacillus sp. AFS014408]PFW60524.1 hypothetical protein COL20_21545 [Bacillus sp. AFS075034]